MTIDSTPSKISYRSEMSVKSQLTQFQTKVGSYNEKVKNALEAVQSNFSFSSQESACGRQTPPHIAIEYIDLVLIPEGEHLKKQLESVKQWMESFQYQQWTECQADACYRKLQFSVDTPVQSLVSCRDNFRKAVAPAEEEKMSALERVVQSVAICTSADSASNLMDGKKIIYNKDAYSQQILHALQGDALSECDEFEAVDDVKAESARSKTEDSSNARTSNTGADVYSQNSSQSVRYFPRTDTSRVSLDSNDDPRYPCEESVSHRNPRVRDEDSDAFKSPTEAELAYRALGSHFNFNQADFSDKVESLESSQSTLRVGNQND